jgi:cell division septal protein FtsQ
VHEHRYNEIAARGLRRRRRERRLMVLRVAAVGLSLALCCEVIAAVLWSPRFGLRNVEIRGARMLDAGAVLAAARLRPGSGLATVRTGAVRRRLEAIPAVAAASVDRDWPDTLVIVIRERIPASYIRCGAGIVFLDRQAVAFTAPRADADGLPQLVGVPLHVGRLGRIQTTRELKSAMAALIAAQEAELGVDRVVARGPNDLELTLADRTVLRLGRPEQLRFKVSQAKLALTQLRRLHEVEYVDVSCPDAAVWKPRAEL